jgi:hypothetical protein
LKTIYICNIFNQDRKDFYSITSDSPAAYNKVKNVSSAIKKSDVDISVVSISMGNSELHTKLENEINNVNGVYYHYLNSYTKKIIKNVHSMFNLLIFLIKNRNKIKNIIFYNYQPEYFLTITAAWLLNKNIIIDVEDGVNTELLNMSFLFRMFLLKYYLLLAKGKLLTVSNNLLSLSSSDNKYICYGSIDEINNRTILKGEKIRLLYSGSMIEETGAEVVVNLLNIISENNELSKKIEFNISGFGKYENIFKEMSEKYKFLNYHGRLSSLEYEKMLTRIDASLVLKTAKSSMGRTTFPSKIIEFSSNGFLIITTKVSDIPLIFDDSEVFFVENEQDILEKISWTVENKIEARIMAKRSQEKAINVFGSKKVGDNIRDIFELGNDK